MAYNVTTSIKENMPFDIICYNGILPCGINWANFMKIILKFDQNKFKSISNWIIQYD
jgi:hypothetical protein